MESPDPHRLMVTQANALARSHQSMTLTEKRLVMLAIALIKRSEVSFRRLRLYVPDFVRIFGVSSKAVYGRLDKATDKLMKAQIRIELGEESYDKFNWVTRAKYLSARNRQNKDGVPYIEIDFNEALGPYLLQLKGQYNSWPITEISSMSSPNSIHLFEILHHDSFAGKRKKLTYELDELRAMLGAADTYPNFKDFRQRILEKAQKDFEKDSVMNFTFKTEKRGRKVGKIIFHLQLKTVANEDAPVPELESNEVMMERLKLIQELKAAGFTQNIHGTIEHYGVDHVAGVLKLAKKQQREAATTHKPVKNLGGLIAYLLKNVDPQKGLFEEPDLRDQGEVGQLAEQLINTVETLKQQEAERIWDELPAVERETLCEMLERDLSPFERSIVEREGRASRGYLAMRNVALFQHRIDLFPSYLHNHREYAQYETSLFGEYPSEVKESILVEADRLIY